MTAELCCPKCGTRQGGEGYDYVTGTCVRCGYFEARRESLASFAQRASRFGHVAHASEHRFPGPHRRKESA